MMWNLVLVALLTAAAQAPVALEVEVQLLDGPVLRGAVTDLSQEGVSLVVDGSPRQLAASDLLIVRPLIEPEPVKDKPDVWVELVDGSRVPASRFAVAGGTAELTLLEGPRLELSTTMIRSVLFKSHASLPDVKKQWDEIRTAAVSGDTIVIRKRSTVAGPGQEPEAVKAVFALDTLEGVLRDITDKVVQFDFDGDVIPVKRERLEGIVYYHPPGQATASPRCRLLSRAGAVWYARSFTLQGDQVQLVTVAGAQLTLPVQQIRQFDYSTGNTVFLSDLEPASVRWEPFFPSSTSSQMLARLFQPRMDRAMDGGKLKLYSQRGFAGTKLGGRERSFDKGIALHSRTVLEYLLPDRYRRLMALAGIDPKVRKRGDVVLRILGDGKTLLEETIRGDDEEPVEVDLDIDGVRRLTIVVDFGQENDIADHLHLCNARLTK